ncbi:MAG: metallophosphoesterase family protein [Planctomycetota bacterium]|jgi:3',5'-cyclic AMP phosphodiesterase CpdA
MQEKVNPEEKKPRKKWLRRSSWKVLLAAVLVIVAGFGIYYLVRPKAPDMIAPVPPATTTYHAVVVGDTQQMPVVEWVVSGGPKERAAVREKIAELDPHFVLLAGDAVGAGAYEPAWNNFRRNYHHIPIWPVLGNHELKGPNKLGLRYYFRAFPHVEGRRWYALRFPPLLFLMLDSNFRTMSDAEKGEQKSWLRAELDRARRDGGVRGIFLLAHHPPFTVHSRGPEETVRADFWGAAAQEPKFLAMFSGHDHNYQHIRVADRRAFVTGGGGAPLYLSEKTELPETAQLVKARSSHHVLHLEVEEGGVRITMHERQSEGGWKEQDETLLPWPEEKR